MSSGPVALFFAGGLERHSPVLESTSPASGLMDLSSCFRSLSPEDRAHLTQDSGLRHARLLNFPCCVGALAAKAVLAGAPPCEPEQRGVLATAGPLHFEIAWRATRQILDEGPDMLNPLLFPQTIPSAIPTAIGALIQAKAFAYCVGHDRLAFFDALRVGIQALRHGHALQVILVSTFDGSSIHAASAGLADATLPRGTAAMSFRIEQGDPDAAHLSILEVVCRKPAITPTVPPERQFLARWSHRGDFQSNCVSGLKLLDGGSASGAVWFLESALHWREQGFPAFQKPFLVACEEEGLSSWLIARWIGE